MANRRPRGEGGITFDHRGPCTDDERYRNCKGTWRAEVTIGLTPEGKRDRKRVKGRTKSKVQDKLKELQAELDKGIITKAGAAAYTVRQAADDWLREGLEGRAPKTVKKNENMLAPLLKVIGHKKLRELTAADVRKALSTMAAGYSSAAVVMGHNALTRTIRHAEAQDLVGRNVATLVDTPKGQAGRPSKSLTLEQATALLRASAQEHAPLELRTGLKDRRRPPELMHAYVMLSLTVGLRTEEIRALRWDHVALDEAPESQPPVPAHVSVWRSVRSHGDTKTELSRRTLELPQATSEALRACWSSKQTNDSMRERDGRTTISCSRPQLGKLWTQRMCGGCSGLCASPPGSKNNGPLGNCGTASSQSCRRPEWPRKRSHASSGIATRGPPKSSTATSCDR
ncbi:MAG TPA: hypothetical protein VKV02_10260 [Acidobacteriaceae bacterium]|nr:hypothetical protein [Acidobacteriaceae bacterium]